VYHRPGAEPIRPLLSASLGGAIAAACGGMFGLFHGKPPIAGMAIWSLFFAPIGAITAVIIAASLDYCPIDQLYSRARWRAVGTALGVSLVVHWLLGLLLLIVFPLFPEFPYWSELLIGLLLLGPIVNAPMVAVVGLMIGLGLAYTASRANPPHP
jgi:hypothetical protein